MDEPTAALGVRESEGVLDLIRRVKERGLAVALISHNLPHVFAVSDRIFVLRQDREAGTLETKKAHVSEVVGLITGVHVAAAVA
jgi:fructose transport system ATP-binding protein